jgi:hypothetical protein
LLRISVLHDQKSPVSVSGVSVSNIRGFARYDPRGHRISLPKGLGSGQYVPGVISWSQKHTHCTSGRQRALAKTTRARELVKPQLSHTHDSQHPPPTMACFFENFLFFASATDFGPSLLLRDQKGDKDLSKKGWHWGVLIPVASVLRVFSELSALREDARCTTKSNDHTSSGPYFLVLFLTSHTGFFCW